jgi:hypothetical protein
MYWYKNLLILVADFIMKYYERVKVLFELSCMNNALAILMLEKILHSIIYVTKERNNHLIQNDQNLDLQIGRTRFMNSFILVDN